MIESTLQKSTLANLKGQVSRETRQQLTQKVPQGAPFWKYTPMTHVIDPEPKCVKMR